MAVLAIGGVFVLVAVWRMTFGNRPAASDGARLRSADLLVEAETFDADVDRIVEHVRKSARTGAGSIVGEHAFFDAVSETLRLYLGGSSADFKAHFESNPEIDPPPERVRRYMDERFDDVMKTVRSGRLASSGIVVRPRLLPGQPKYDYDDHLSVTVAERPGRIKSLPDPEKAEQPIYEVVLPMDIVGHDASNVEVPFPGRVGLWFVRDRSGGWQLYKIAIYDAPNGVGIRMPFL